MNHSFLMLPKKRQISKALVLGSNSFAGATTINACLSLGISVWGISRSQELSEVMCSYSRNSNINSFKFKQIDINNDLESLIDLINSVKPDAILDFAGQGMVAQSWKNPDQWYQTNILAKSKLHKVLLDNPHLQAYIRISTPEVYGSSDKLLTEVAPYNPSTPYAVSHAATDMSLAAFFKQYNFPVMTSRFSNFYGPGQQLYRIVPRTMLAAMGHGKLTLDGGGTSVRSFIYSTDIANGILATLLNGVLGETYHFSSDEFVSIRELVDSISDVMEVDTKSFCQDGPDRMGKDAAYLMNAKKACETIGWLPETTLLSGLNQTASWVKSNFSALKKIPIEYNHQA